MEVKIIGIDCATRPQKMGLAFAVYDGRQCGVTGAERMDLGSQTLLR